MITHKKIHRWLYVTVVFLPLAVLLSGCGDKALAPEPGAALSPVEKQKAVVDTQQGAAREAARRQAEQASKAR